MSEPIPSTVRRAVLKRACGRCEDCGERVRAELHHLHYRTVGQEDPDDLAALCRNCHYGRHLDPNGDFWRDPEDLADAWFGYRLEMDKA